MPGTATVTINEKQWTVSIASTYTELISGLSGVVSIPAKTGVLFDMGVDQSSIRVDMSQMLFALDIVFINSTYGVVGVLHNVQPGEEARFEADGLGARYFLEVNAGEVEDVQVGDSVSISGDVQPTFWAGLIAAVYALSTVAIVGAGAYKTVKQELAEAKKAGKPPEGEHHSIHGPERQKLVDLYGSWSVGRAESVCPEGDIECVRRESARLLGAYRRGFGV